MAKRKPARRKPVTIVEFGKGKAKPVASSWKPNWYVIGTSLAVFGSLASSVMLWVLLQTPRGVQPEDERSTYPVVKLTDAPGVAMKKSHARYMLNFADSLDEFADKAKEFTESGDAAKWFAERTAKARTEAFAGEGGFDAYIFGHAGGTDSGEDRYDWKALAAGAKEMARASREAAKSIAGQR